MAKTTTSSRSKIARNKVLGHKRKKKHWLKYSCNIQDKTGKPVRMQHQPENTILNKYSLQRTGLISLSHRKEGKKYQKSFWQRHLRFSPQNQEVQEFSGGEMGITSVMPRVDTHQGKTRSKLNDVRPTAVKKSNLNTCVFNITSQFAAFRQQFRGSITY